MKILFVEDDQRLARLLTRAFREEGFVVDVSTTGEDGLSQALAGIYDLLVLDWMLPDLDGLSLCRKLRERGQALPILMLTARAELAERVMGLNAGVDDYVVKPFELEELIARVRALLRRAGAPGKILVGELEINCLSRRVTVKDSLIDLTTREYALLNHLARKAGATVTRSQLLHHVWSARFDPGSNLVEVHVSRLREKLGERAWMLETVRGSGYRLRVERPASP